MAGLVNASKNSMLDHLGTLVGFASLHTADPGTSGTSEVAGGAPAYARKAITWAGRCPLRGEGLIGIERA